MVVDVDEGSGPRTPTTYLGRALLALELLATEPRSPSQLAQPLAVNRSTALRLLKDLESLGYVRRDKTGTLYDVVIERFAPIIGAGREADWRTRAYQVLVDVHAATGEATVLGVPAGPWMVYVDYVPSQHLITVSERVGSIRPIHASALGKAWLSSLDDHVLTETFASLRYEMGTKHAAHSPEGLRSHVEEVRARGWAVDQEEYRMGVVCVAVPLFVEGQSHAAIAVSGPASRIDPEAMEVYAAKLLSCAEKAGLSRAAPG